MAEDTPWLDGEEMRIWLGFLEASGRVDVMLDESLKVAAGLTMDDYDVLVHLSAAEGHRLRMSDLSERLLHSQSRVTQRIDRLASRGLVYREKSVDDRRGIYACLTNEGFDLIKELAPGHLRDVRRLLIDLIEPHERAVIADVLERVVAAARAANQASSEADD